MYRQPRYRLKKRVRFTITIILFLTLLIGGSLWAAGLLDKPFYDIEVTDIPEKPDVFKGRLNVLLLGTDTRKGETLARADTIMLCSIDTEKDIMSILSIPRDTMVNIPGHGLAKINSATVYGGPSLTMKLVSDLLDIRVNNYAMMDYEGFKKIVDALGGVTVDVKERMYHYDPEDGGIYTINIKPGVHRLSGEKALQYVRYRSYALGDIERTEQQQKFLAALIKEVLQPSTIIRLPSLIISAYKAVDTNLSLPEMKELAEAASKMTNSNLVTQTLPGKFLTMDGVSYWEPDPHHTRQVVAGVLEGRSVSKVVLGETTVVTTGNSQPDGQKTQGKVVPGQPVQGEGVKIPKTGISDASVKTGTSGQAPTGGGATTGDGKKQATGITTSNKAEVRPSQTDGQSTGGIVPPDNPKQDHQTMKKDQSTTTL